MSYREHLLKAKKGVTQNLISALSVGIMGVAVAFCGLLLSGHLNPKPLYIVGAGVSGIGLLVTSFRLGELVGINEELFYASDDEMNH